ncbi:MAG: 3',5'-cyclic-nucleotide phosphodiesterase, partial [Giesbergeria sp.]
MKIRVLGCSGAISQGCRTTSFLVNGNILIDAGTGVGDLTLDEMAAIDHVFLTHSHLDHIAALPLMIDSVAALRRHPLQVHALPGTIEALRAHIFNDTIWPDFSRIPSSAAPLLRFVPLATGDVLSVGGATLEALPAAHTVPAVGYAVQGKRGWWVFSGDTGGGNPAFWQRTNALPVAMLVIETAFSRREYLLAERSQHLS